VTGPRGGVLNLTAHGAGPAADDLTVTPLGTGAALVSDGEQTLLWAPHADLPDALPPELPATGLDVVVLPARVPIAPHLIARLRAAGAVTERTDVVLVQVGHDWSERELGPALARWGARVVPGGTRLGRAPGWARPHTAHRTLVLGPARSGKSGLAELLLAAEPQVTYVATGPPPTAADPAWRARVEAHRARRPDWWRVRETTDPAAVLATVDTPVLLDSLGTWLAAAMDRCGAHDDEQGWRDRLEADLDHLVDAWRQVPAPAVAVAEETGWGVVPATSSGRRFRDLLGGLNQGIAADSESVLLCVAGQVLDLGGAG
jgi:adenosylcobinamide kinase/adenosylcobinamide-phosphate guanylyltransferase